MAFEYRQQPVKTLLILGGSLWILARLPFWALRNLLPSWRPRRNWSLARSVLVSFAHAAVAIMMLVQPPATQSFESLSKEPGYVWVEAVPEELIHGEIKRLAKINEVTVQRVGGFWYTRNGVEKALPEKAKPGEKIFYLIHGGGFVMGNASPSFATTQIGISLLEYAHEFGILRAFSVEYRLACGPPLPIKNPFPACILDVLSGYNYLVHTLNFAPENIIVAGDSAGGTISYQLVRYCTSYRAELSGKLPAPGALLLLSPSIDAFRPVAGSMISNRRSDYMATFYDPRYPVAALLGKGLKEEDIDRPWFAPGSNLFSDDDEEIKGVFTDFPKTMIVTGEAEMSRDGNRVLNERMVKEMGKDRVVYAEIEDAPHDFIIHKIWEPERTIGLKAISKWIAEL